MADEASQTEPERPSKRIRLTSTEQDAPDDTQLRKELRAGIIAYVSPSTKGFSGTLKQRYTDFQVNEILPDGRVLHLESDDLPKADVIESSDAAVESKSREEKKRVGYDASEIANEESGLEHTPSMSNVDEDAAETAERGDQSHNEVLRSDYMRGLKALN